MLSRQEFCEEKRKIEDACMLNSSKRKRSEGEVGVEMFNAKMQVLKAYAESKIRGLESGVRDSIKSRFDQMLRQLTVEFKCMPLS